MKAALASSEVEHKAETKKRAIPRKAAGQSWEDPTLAEWPESTYCNSVFQQIKLLIAYSLVSSNLNSASINMVVTKSNIHDMEFLKHT